jgi:hypothetical protein
MKWEPVNMWNIVFPPNNLKGKKSVSNPSSLLDIKPLAINGVIEIASRDWGVLHGWDHLIDKKKLK